MARIQNVKGGTDPQQLWKADTEFHFPLLPER